MAWEPLLREVDEHNRHIAQVGTACMDQTLELGMIA